MPWQVVERDVVRWSRSQNSLGKNGGRARRCDSQCLLRRSLGLGSSLLTLCPCVSCSLSCMSEIIHTRNTRYAFRTSGTANTLDPPTTQIGIFWEAAAGTDLSGCARHDLDPAAGPYKVRAPSPPPRNHAPLPAHPRREIFVSRHPRSLTRAHAGGL